MHNFYSRRVFYINSLPASIFHLNDFLITTKFSEDDIEPANFMFFFRDFFSFSLQSLDILHFQLLTSFF